MQGFTFQDFFRQATGYPPYLYQASLATSKRLPEVLNIPTGLGKTAAVVLAWLWRRFVGEGITNKPPEQVRSETPRRLVYCLPMRVLVEQTAGSTRQWVENLVAANTLPSGKRPAVQILMGGEIDRDWDFWPEREAILIGTQDQLLSRALNRGYAMSRFRWPIHFALLNNDCLWVMDEVQLMGPGLPTSIQLQGFRERLGAYSPTRCIWMSATVSAGSFTTIDSPLAGKDWGDICLDLGVDAENPAVRSRLHARKSLHKCNAVLSKGNQKSYTEELAAEVATLHEKSKGLTIVILNRVRRAQEVARALKIVFADKGQSPGVTLIHSRFRPHERRSVERLLKDLSAGHTAEHVLVATQAIEAGVDISASTLVTELAPWPSIIQRFGRLNRYGELETAQACWVDIAWKREENGKVITDPGFALPYEGNELDLAREQLQKLTDVGSHTLKSLTVSSLSKPYPLLRKKDIIELFDTTPDLAGSDIDVSNYIRDMNDMDVSVLWREWDGDRPPDSLPAPGPEELCPVAIYEIRDFLQDREAWIWDALERSWLRVDRKRLRPGLVLLMHSQQGGYDPELGWLGREARRPVDPVISSSESPEEATGDDPFTTTKEYLSIANHSTVVVREVKDLLDASTNNDLPANDLYTAARWHDRGKAHFVFQNALKENSDSQNKPTVQDELLAKGPYLGKYERPYFRHELASALAALLNGESDLAAYLAAAHHGKVRLSIRSLPKELVPHQGKRFARGVWEGDILPSVDLGGGIIAPEVTLSLTLMELGQSEQHGPSWLERSLRLLEKHGPFRLAYLESLLRIADWRASCVTGQDDDE